MRQVREKGYLGLENAKNVKGGQKSPNLSSKVKQNKLQEYKIQDLIPHIPNDLNTAHFKEEREHITPRNSTLHIFIKIIPLILLYSAYCHGTISSLNEDFKLNSVKNIKCGEKHSHKYQNVMLQLGVWGYFQSVINMA